MSAAIPDSRQTLGPVRRGVIGILARGQTLLVIRRAAGIPKAGHWCFPGGHVEKGETSKRAIRRELAEELGIEAEPIVRVGAVRVDESNYILAVWRVRHAGGELRLAPSEIAEVRWLTPSQIRALCPVLPSNDRVLEMLGV